MERQEVPQSEETTDWSEFNLLRYTSSPLLADFTSPPVAGMTRELLSGSSEHIVAPQPQPGQPRRTSSGGGDPLSRSAGGPDAQTARRSDGPVSSTGAFVSPQPARAEASINIYPSHPDFDPDFYPRSRSVPPEPDTALVVRPPPPQRPRSTDPNATRRRERHRRRDSSAHSGARRSDFRPPVPLLPQTVPPVPPLPGYNHYQHYSAGQHQYPPHGGYQYHSQYPQYLPPIATSVSSYNPNPHWGISVTDIHRRSERITRDSQGQVAQVDSISVVDRVVAPPPPVSPVSPVGSYASHHPADYPQYHRSRSSGYSAPNPGISPTSINNTGWWLNSDAARRTGSPDIIVSGPLRSRYDDQPLGFIPPNVPPPPSGNSESNGYGPRRSPPSLIGSYASPRPWWRSFLRCFC